MQKLFIANWKSNKNQAEALSWLEQFEKALKIKVALGKVEHEIVICPPFSLLETVANFVQESIVLKHVLKIGVQDLSPFPEGSYTGAVTIKNLEHLPIQYAIVGHSERRKYFHETSQEVAQKVEECLSEKMTPVICLDRKEVKSQAALIEYKNYSKIVVAYEPVEHIGSGIAQNPDEVLTVFEEIHQAFPGTRVIYGGSVNPRNIDQFLSYDDITGFLVGSASLEAESFYELCNLI